MIERVVVQDATRIRIVFAILQKEGMKFQNDGSDMLRILAIRVIY